MPIKRSGPTHLSRKYVDVVRLELYLSTYVHRSSHNRLILNENKKAA